MAITYTPCAGPALTPFQHTHVRECVLTDTVPAFAWPGVSGPFPAEGQNPLSWPAAQRDFVPVTGKFEVGWRQVWLDPVALQDSVSLAFHVLVSTRAPWSSPWQPRVMSPQRPKFQEGE